MSVLTMRAVGLPSGETIPVLGMGTWHLAEGRHPPEVELDALRTGLDLLEGIGRRHRATSTQVALSWVISHPGVCAIPQAGTPEHVRENADALRVMLRDDDVAELDAAFPPPPHPVPLEVL
ncbi:MAG TPA: aldo/keto reductase [Baekduia sp.]|jgi:diketogulonate reductase-like aldo/keto reductase